MRTVLIAILLAALAAAEQKRSADPHFGGGFYSYGYPLYGGFNRGFNGGFNRGIGFPSVYSYGYGYPFYTRSFRTIWKRSADANPSPVHHRISKRSANPNPEPNPAAAEQKRSADPHFGGGFYSYGYPLYGGFNGGFNRGFNGGFNRGIGFPSVYSYGYGYPFYTRPFRTIWKRSANANPSPVHHRISKRSANPNPEPNPNPSPNPVADPNPDPSHGLYSIGYRPYSFGGLGYGGLGGYGRGYGLGYGGFGGYGGYGYPRTTFTYVRRYPSYGYGW